MLSILKEVTNITNTIVSMYLNCLCFLKKYTMENSLIFLFLALIISSCQKVSDSSKTNLSILNDKHQSSCYIEPETSHGQHQSPINIITYKAKKGKHLSEAHYDKSAEHVVHKEHTVQVNYDKGSYFSFDNERYDFKQFHFHTPSEHLVDGVTYPLEMHAVHVLEEKNPKEPHYLVIGCLFKEGRENHFINEFLNDVPETINQEKHENSKEVNINDLLSRPFNEYKHYFYEGSLTTAPFTETVKWIILEEIFEASPEQIKKLNQLEGDNARHAQALYDRTVEIF